MPGIKPGMTNNMRLPCRQGEKAPTVPSPLGTARLWNEPILIAA